MGLFFVYILKTSFCLTLFYIFYKLLLSKDTFHRFNRIMLLSVMILSFMLPLIEFTLKEPTKLSTTFLSIEEIILMQSMPGERGIITTQVPTITWYEMAVLIYWIGILFFFLRNAWAILQIVKLIRNCKKIEVENGIKVFVHKKKLPPFSWMKYIVISEKDYEDSSNEILIHEKAHILNYHSIDVIIADLCIFLQWFNPAAWLMKQELQNIHEYEADESVINHGIETKRYQLLLIKKAIGPRFYSISNSFNHSSLKIRITMMLKEKSNPWARMKYLYIIPIVALSVTAFARPEVNSKLDKFTDVITENTAKEYPLNDINGNQTPAFRVVDKMPEFPGGMPGLLNYLTKNIQYPTLAKKEKIEGRVVVQFIVDKEGNAVNPKIVRSISPELDAEALRVINEMPKWIPGKQKGKAVDVYFTIPVTFKLT